MTCDEHIGDVEKLPYVQWDAKAATAREKQIRCAECGRYYFSWERRETKLPGLVRG